jgi:hypothetical protein
MKTSTDPAALRWDLPITPDGDSASRYAVYRFDHAPSLPGELADARNMLMMWVSGSMFAYTPPGGRTHTSSGARQNYSKANKAVSARPQRPGIPVLASPADGSTGVAESVLVVWNGALLASSYHLQGSVDSTFVSGLFTNGSLSPIP